MRPQQQLNKREKGREGYCNNSFPTRNAQRHGATTMVTCWQPQQQQQRRGESSSPRQNKKSKECSFAALQLATMEGTIKDTARRKEKEWQREDTRHGSRWRIKPQTRQRHWQPAAGHQSQSFWLSLCPSACRCDDFEARRGHMRVSQVHFALAVQKFNQEVQRARRVQHPQAASSYFPLPALSLFLPLSFFLCPSPSQNLSWTATRASPLRVMRDSFNIYNDFVILPTLYGQPS